jgi:hypothetical protein
MSEFCHHKPVFISWKVSAAVLHIMKQILMLLLAPSLQLSQQSAQHKILNMSEHEQQERSDYLLQGT